MIVVILSQSVLASKWPVTGVNGIEVWDGGGGVRLVHTCIWCSFDLVIFKVILGSLSLIE